MNGSARCWCRTAAVAVALGLPGAHAASLPTIDVVLRTGEPAPEITGATIESFVEPPSIIEGTSPGEAWMALHVTIAGAGITPETSHVIYRWSSSQGLRKIAQGGDTVLFFGPVGGGGHAEKLTFLESPIAGVTGKIAFTAQTDILKRALVVADPANQEGMAIVGDGVSITCESVSGAPCGPVAGTLNTMPTFADRRGLAFATYYEPELDIAEHNVAFRGFVQTSGFGTPDALWSRSIYEGDVMPLTNVSNSLMKADGIGSATTYFDDFTDVVISERAVFGLATVSQGAPFAIYRFLPTAGQDHQLLARYHAPDMVARRDLHAGEFDLAYAGGVTDMQFDGDISTKGVWLLEKDGSPHLQVYQANLTPAPGIAGATLGPPIGQALYANTRSAGAPATLFAANLTGGALAGRASAWRSGFGGEAELLVHESQASPVGSTVDALWTAHVNRFGDAAFHMRLADQRQVIFVVDVAGQRIPVIKTGDQVPGGLTVQSMWTLGGTFGSDPVVTGAGNDGVQGAFTADGRIAALVTFTTAGGAVIVASVPLLVFSDSFEG